MGAIFNNKSCPNGHEYTKENTRIDKRGSQSCIICRTLRYARQRSSETEYRKRNQIKINENQRKRYHKNIEKSRERVRADQKKLRAQNPLALRRSKFRRNYGLELEQVVEMLLLQDSLCKICKKQIVFHIYSNKEVTAQVDHSHVTGQVRGILCGQCNPGIGYVL